MEKTKARRSGRLTGWGKRVYMREPRVGTTDTGKETPAALSGKRVKIYWSGGNEEDGLIHEDTQLPS